MTSTALTLTWTFSTAAVLALGIAGALALSGQDQDGQLAASPPGEAPEASAPRTDPSTALREPNLDAPQSPFDIAAEMVDASRRAKTWNNESCLSALRVVTRDGRRDVTELVFGVAQGRALPGTPLRASRLTLSYDGKGLASRAESQVSQAGRCLPEPNCPLQAAIQAVTQAGAQTGQNAGGFYLRSTKYDRAVWTISAPEQPLYHVDGDNCALLRR